MSDFREPLSCRVCGEAVLSRLGPCPAYASSGLDGFGTLPSPGALYRCAGCGLGLREPCLPGPELQERYRDAAPAEEMRYEFSANTAWMLAREVLQKRWSGDAAPWVLDTGCHEGSFLRGLPPGWNRFGVEPNRAAAAIAATGSVTILGGLIEEVAQGWRDRFDAVCMFDVLEHLYDPGRGLKAALECVKPGGLLIVSTGNLDAWPWRLVGNGHWYLACPQHVSIASPRFLRWFCRGQPARIVRLLRISHQRGRLGQVVEDVVALAYFACRRRGGLLRLPQRAIQGLNRYRRLMHMKEMPATFRLRDHLLAILEKIPAGGRPGPLMNPS